MSCGMLDPSRDFIASPDESRRCRARSNSEGARLAPATPPFHVWTLAAASLKWVFARGRESFFARH